MTITWQMFTVPGFNTAVKWTIYNRDLRIRYMYKGDGFGKLHERRSLPSTFGTWGIFHYFYGRKSVLQVGRLTCQRFFSRYCLQLCSYNRIQTNWISTQLEDSMSLTLFAPFQLSACSIDLSSSTAVPKGTENMAMDR